MVSANDVHQQDLVEVLAAELKNIKEIQMPDWGLFVKTGVAKERPPVQKDWWYLRAASVLKNVSKLGPIGVSKLRKKYSSKKNRGMASDKVFKASGSIIRKILQQLEKAGLVVSAQKDIHKGKILTAKGKSLLDKAASNVKKAVPKQKKEKHVTDEKQASKKVAPAAVEKKEVKKKPEVKVEEPSGEMAKETAEEQVV
ncbi:MAG: 30S ribosomal protein S19e [archaeon]